MSGKGDGNLILKGRKVRVRVLTPSEYISIEDQAQKDPRRGYDSLRGLLMSGVRWVEGVRLQQNPDWYIPDRMAIHLPYYSVLKEKAMVDRWILLNPKGAEAIEQMLKAHPLPTRQSFDETIKKWATDAGISSSGICAKSTRKTYESWLSITYPEKSNLIFQSQGHNRATSLQYYISIPFTKKEKDDMVPWVEGWGQT